MKKSGRNQGGSDPESKLVEIDKPTALAANLQLLKVKDPSVESVVCQASHVTVYVFNADLKQWARKNVEGALFIVHRSKPPEYQLIVLNRLNASNMTQPIAEAMRLKLVKLYLMFLSPDPCSMGEESLMEVPHGIWFYNEEERGSVFREMQTLIRNAAKRRPSDQQYAATLQQCPETKEAPAAPVGGKMKNTKATTTNSRLIRRHSSSEQLNKHSKPTKMPEQNKEVPLLDPHELKETLIALMDDDRFITMLHAQYRSRVWPSWSVYESVTVFLKFVNLDEVDKAAAFYGAKDWKREERHHRVIPCCPDVK